MKNNTVAILMGVISALVFGWFAFHPEQQILVIVDALLMTGSYALAE